jgi:hypothetical protein
MEIATDTQLLSSCVMITAANGVHGMAPVGTTNWPLLF